MTARSLEKIVDEQVTNWNLAKTQTPEQTKNPVLTVSREAGTGGQALAKDLAEQLGFDFFDQELVHKMSEAPNISARLMKSLDEKGSSIIEEWLTAFSENFWPDQYLRQLVHVVGTIGHHGGAVVVGRGAQFILPSSACISIRIIAPLKYRVKNMAKEQQTTHEEAEKKVLKEDSQRKAFIRKYFYTDITEPHNYDLLLNINKISFPYAIKTIRSLIENN